MSNTLTSEAAQVHSFNPTRDPLGSGLCVECGKVGGGAIHDVEGAEAAQDWDEIDTVLSEYFKDEANAITAPEGLTDKIMDKITGSSSAVSGSPEAALRGISSYCGEYLEPKRVDSMPNPEDIAGTCKLIADRALAAAPSTPVHPDDEAVAVELAQWIGIHPKVTRAELVERIAQALASEREACAKIADDYYEFCRANGADSRYKVAAKEIAAAIRNRKGKDDASIS